MSRCSRSTSRSTRRTWPSPASRRDRRRPSCWACAARAGFARLHLPLPVRGRRTARCTCPAGATRASEDYQRGRGRGARLRGVHGLHDGQRQLPLRSRPPARTSCSRRCPSSSGIRSSRRAPPRARPTRSATAADDPGPLPGRLLNPHSLPPTRRPHVPPPPPPGSLALALIGLQARPHRAGAQRRRDPLRPRRAGPAGAATSRRRYKEYAEVAGAGSGLPRGAQRAGHPAAPGLQPAGRRPSAHYKKALELRPGFSEAKTNLANVLPGPGRAMTRPSSCTRRRSTTCSTPRPSSRRATWAGRSTRRATRRSALQNIKAAVTTNPDFCLGYKNLGIIYDETGKTDEACRQFGHYRETVPGRGGRLPARGRVPGEAGPGGGGAEERSPPARPRPPTSQVLKDDCRRLLEHLVAPEAARPRGPRRLRQIPRPSSASCAACRARTSPGRRRSPPASSPRWRRGRWSGCPRASSCVNYIRAYAQRHRPGARGGRAPLRGGGQGHARAQPRVLERERRRRAWWVLGVMLLAVLARGRVRCSW